MASNDGDNDVKGKVGYRHPPTKNQFIKGQSGNPKGRPKGDPVSKSLAASVAAFLQKKVQMTDIDGKRKIVPAANAIATQLGVLALKGNLPAMKLLGIGKMVDDISATESALSDADARAKIDAKFDRILGIKRDEDGRPIDPKPEPKRKRQKH
jgi:hypothetical protein